MIAAKNHFIVAILLLCSTIACKKSEPSNNTRTGTGTGTGTGTETYTYKLDPKIEILSFSPTHATENTRIYIEVKVKKPAFYKIHHGTIMLIRGTEGNISAPILNSNDKGELETFTIGYSSAVTGKINILDKKDPWTIIATSKTDFVVHPK